MAYHEIVEGTKQQKAARPYVLDSVDDLDSIPADKAGPGSVAVVPSAGKVFFKTPSGAWVPYGSNE